jgi:CBS domain-containing protein
MGDNEGWMGPEADRGLGMWNRDKPDIITEKIMDLTYEPQPASVTKGVINCLERVCQETKTPYKDRRYISDIMTQPVEVLTLDHSVKTFLSFMQVNHVRHAPVVDYPQGRHFDHEFIGVISQRDVLRLGPSNVTGKLSDEPDPRALRQLLSRVVTRKAQTVGPDMPIGPAVQRMIDLHIDMLPVVVEKKVVGIVTTTDILRMIVRTAETIEQACRREIHCKDAAAWADGDNADRAVLGSFMVQTAGTAMARNLVTMTANQTLAEAIETLQKHELRHVPIVDEDNHLIGILSDRDILRNLPYLSRSMVKTSTKFREDLFRIEGSKAVLNQQIENVMTKKLWTIEPNCPLVEAALLLMKKKVGVLPVVDSERRILGIVSVVDLLSVVQSMVE